MADRPGQIEEQQDNEATAQETAAAAEPMTAQQVAERARSLNVRADLWDEEYSPEEYEAMLEMYEETLTNVEEGEIVKARVLRVTENAVILDVGFKSEGAVPRDEFKNPEQLQPGDEVDVFLENLEDEEGVVVLSKKKADFLRVWEKIKTAYENDEKVPGTLMRKIKGGVTVDLMGVDAFLPGSQIALRRVPNIEDLIGQTFDFKIIKLNKRRRNIVVSRRVILEEEREGKREQLVKELLVGQVRHGVVKNLADFGAFVDLGGLDGLLHITDMSWGRIGHPSEMLQMGQEIEVVVLAVDRDKEKIALGLKQKSENPWEQVEGKFPTGTRLKGKVVNIMSYGAFVQLEEGLEGLVHISEMSWTRRINHPSEVVNVDDEVEVVVLEVDRDKQEISLGMKQAETNPWTLVKEKYPPGTVISGTVRNMTNYGAFVEIEEGIDGLLHVSDLSWTRKVGHPSEVLKKGQELQCVVLAVDEDKMRVALGLKQLTEDPWLRHIPDHYLPGQIVCGKVTKITNFGVFVELEEELEGLLHVSELA